MRLILYLNPKIFKAVPDGPPDSRPWPRRQLLHDLRRYSFQVHLSTPSCTRLLDSYYIYVTAVMDITAGTVQAGPNLTGRMDSGMNANI